ncbi:hypothetical protein SAMN05660473_01887 [Arthrobacter sp. 49Tsu3.1M3]|uniref:hypothetical protein n=1 Tax=Arthrobacter sp. 49Tsu3.1M3 TaxID=1279029 RepID=UPI0009A59FD2|nr:hypothetical protein [Arthrobacter sp. 49Tsu3.1M3]SKB68303.1 hypothetical protein SAMN05660473_01887 [Arthrobacter sp. 49Tsu3.1M3]
MTEHDGELPAADREAADEQAAEQQEPQAAEPRKDQRSKQHETYVSGGAESTREMREMSRRRREAEEKLQQHLLEAKEKPAED